MVARERASHLTYYTVQDHVQRITVIFFNIDDNGHEHHCLNSACELGIKLVINHMQPRFPIACSGGKSVVAANIGRQGNVFCEESENEQVVNCTT